MQPTFAANFFNYGGGMEVNDSWLIGRTDSEREIRVYRNLGGAEQTMQTIGYTEIDYFQTYAALEAYSLYVLKRYPDDLDLLKIVLENKDDQLKKIRHEIDILENHFSINTSIDLCNFGRKFLLAIFTI